MSITIEGYSIVVKKELIEPLLDSEKVVPKNQKSIGDDHIWRFAFMSESDAIEFRQRLQDENLNLTEGPDSDGVLVSEFHRNIEPYCEWLELVQWEKAVIAWKTGTDPRKLIAREGFDPAIGSGLQFHDKSDMDQLEFLRLDGNVEVYRDKETGEEVFLGRTSTPTEAIYQESCKTIQAHFKTAGQPPLEGEESEAVTNAVNALGKLLEEDPDWWQALFFHGKGLIGTGNYEAAYKSLSRAYQLEKTVEAIPRELGGLCLEFGNFEEAVEIGEHAATLLPDNPETIGNLALSYLMAAKIPAARKSIDAALELAPDDKINQRVEGLIAGVESGDMAQPKSMAELQTAMKKKPKQ